MQGRIEGSTTAFSNGTPKPVNSGRSSSPWVKSLAQLCRRRSRANAALVLPIAIFGGLCIGLGIAAWAELADRTFRTPEHIAERLKIDCDRSPSAYIRDPLGSPQNPPVNPGGQKEHIPT
jgi:hypothetical protein